MAEEKEIRFMSGLKYKVIGDKVISLNWAEKGMHGQSKGKELPPELAKKVLEEAEIESNMLYKIHGSRESKPPAKSMKPKDLITKDTPKRKRKKRKKTGKKKESKGTGIKLSGLMKK